MTIKEIARLCGVREQTVRNWTHKAAKDPTKNLQGLINKLEEAEKSGTTPADYTLEETLAIIRAGGNETLASLLAENAANKNAVSTQTAPGVNYANFEARLETIIHKKLKELLPDPKTHARALLPKNMTNIIKAYECVNYAYHTMAENPERVKQKAVVFEKVTDKLKDAIISLSKEFKY